MAIEAATGVRMVVAPGRVEYKEALDAMEQAREGRRNAQIPDTFIYLEHEPVVTYGRSTPPEHLHRREHTLPTVEVSRGGLATYHGPGQLVGYGIIDLSKRADGLRPDIAEYLRALESGLIDFLLYKYDLRALQREGHTGVWVQDEHGMRKIASIGVSARHWVTAHGFALNLSPDLEAFGSIVPCGEEAEAVMTSVENECRLAGRPYEPESMLDVARRVHVHICNALHKSGWCRVI